MILYGAPNPAPNPRRVRIFLAEKGVELAETPVNIMKREHKSEEHRARNSLGQVPTLVLLGLVLPLHDVHWRLGQLDPLLRQEDAHATGVRRRIGRAVENHGWLQMLKRMELRYFKRAFEGS